MSDNIKRVLLTDEEAGTVAGGNIHYVCTETERYCYGEHDPGTKYGYYSKSAMLAFVDANYDLYGEYGTLQMMLNQGIIYPLSTSTAEAIILE